MPFSVYNNFQICLDLVTDTDFSIVPLPARAVSGPK